MIAVKQRPELVTPELLAWLRPKVGSYEGSGGQLGIWLVREEPLPPLLAVIAGTVCPGVDFFTVHLQCYEHGRAKTPCHADRGRGAGFILSMGATRTLRLHRLPEGVKGSECGDVNLDVFEIECSNGTVVFMDEEAHVGWHHLIPAEPDVTGERLALVFRTKPTNR